MQDESNRSEYRVGFHTLGCKLNYAETSAISDRYRSRGFDVVELDDRPELVVINSCTVTRTAEKECRQIVRRVVRENPTACVVVTGCYAQLRPEQIASIEGVDYVLGSSEKFRMHEIVKTPEKRETPRVDVSDVGNETAFGPAFTSESDQRTRAFLKVQDGCDYNCSFCTIPLARGGSRSQPMEDAVEQARVLVERGYREIVLTGVNTGDYGRNDGTSLEQLLLRLHDVPDLLRLRISSIEPNLLTEGIVRLAADSEIMAPHFHIPLQSGCDDILKRMRRRYRSGLYRDRVRMILDQMPHAGIGVDVIVGFPGETDQRFEESYRFIESLPVEYLHVFTYSERENTPAREFDGRVPIERRKERTRRLRELSKKKRALFAGRYQNEVRPVLFESAKSDGSVQGYSDNYIRVSVDAGPFENAKALEGRIVPVAIGGWTGAHAAGSTTAPVHS